MSRLLDRQKGPGTSATYVHLAAVKPPASRPDVYYSGFGLGQKWSIADVRRSKDIIGNVTSSIRNIPLLNFRPTAIKTYASCSFLYYLRVRIRN